MAGVNPIDKALADAKSLQKRKEELFAEIAANREILRNFSTGGYLEPEQVKYVEETYPKRELSEETLAKRAKTRAQKTTAVA